MLEAVLATCSSMFHKHPPRFDFPTTVQIMFACHVPKQRDRVHTSKRRNDVQSLRACVGRSGTIKFRTKGSGVPG